MEHVKTNGIALAVQVWPGGPPSPPTTIVAVHGLTANHACWYPMAGLLGTGFRLVAYDLRGRGNSDKPERGYNLTEHARDLRGLLDHFDVARAVIMGHSLGAHIAVWFAAHHPERVAKLVLFDGGFDVRAEVFDSLAPAVGRLGVEFPSLETFLGMLQGLPMFAGRWNDALTRYFTYDVEPGPAGGVRSKVPRYVIEEEAANLQRTRLWAQHHRIQAPTLLIRAPDGLLRDDDHLMTPEEAEAMRRAIPDCRLVLATGTNHYTVIFGEHPGVAQELVAFLRS